MSATAFALFLGAGVWLTLAMVYGALSRIADELARGNALRQAETNERRERHAEQLARASKVTPIDRGRR